MADFSDKEDQRLVQLLIEHEKKGQKRVSWIEIANLMKSRKSPEQLRLRVVCLKRRFGNLLVQFPRRYLVNLQPKPVKKVQREANEISATEQSVDTSLIDLFNELCSGDEDLNFALPNPPSTASQPARATKLRKRVKPTVIFPLSANDTYVALKQILGAVRKVDVYQARGRIETNVGELTPIGTTGLIEVCALTNKDVFVDIGSGVGNVVAQVALQTNIGMAIGVEIRTELALQSSMLMERHSMSYPQLNKIKIYPENICDIDIENDESFQKATVLFCHNTLFRPEVHLEVEKVCCRLPHLRTVVISLPFCSRHRASCLREFCTLFRFRGSPIEVSVTFTHSLSRLFIYDRNDHKRQVLS